MKIIKTLLIATLSFNAVSAEKFIDISELKKIRENSYNERLSKTDTNQYVNNCIKNINISLSNAAKYENLKIMNDNSIVYYFTSCVQKRVYEGGGYKDLDANLIIDLVLVDLLKAGYKVSAGDVNGKYHISW